MVPGLGWASYLYNGQHVGTGELAAAVEQRRVCTVWVERAVVVLVQVLIGELGCEVHGEVRLLNMGMVMVRHCVRGLRPCSWFRLKTAMVPV